MSHTPGPWHLHDLSVHFGHGEGGVSLHKDTPNARANACLMAAAPEMLEALELVAPFICQKTEPLTVKERNFILKISTLLAKARGAS